jgi:NifB/MoaA-like Fe-S oxidoreductase
VPLGVSAHNHEAEMREHTTSEAATVIDTVERWQRRFQTALGRRLVFASDEYYLLAQRSFPAYDEYEGFVQHENGVGMARTFEAEVRDAIAGAAVRGTRPRTGFFAWVDGAPAEGYRAPRGATEVALSFSQQPRPVTIITGELGARVLDPLLTELGAHAQVDVDLLPVPNTFFGGNIGVTGLLTGADVARALDGVDAGDRVLLPDVTLSGDHFLDGTSVADLPRPVEVIATDGASLVGALS